MSTERDDHYDDGVDATIAGFLDPDNPQSFFLYAGAGSGKTRSLTTALRVILSRHSEKLRRESRRVGVISYTNAACDEIENRIDCDPLVEVATIHSFSWSLIQGFDRDIRSWLREALAADIAQIEQEQRGGRSGTKAADARSRRLASKSKRLAELDQVKHFTYDPTGEKVGLGALNHADVIKITSEFLATKPVLGTVLVTRFPILLIDESQDTHRTLIEALVEVQKAHRDRFLLGLFGDTMQRIYGDGMPDPERTIPDDWHKPAKQMNHRSARRIVALANKLREGADGHSQLGREDRGDGHVRLFVAHNAVADKAALELRAAAEMADVSGDDAWRDTSSFKTLTLEHHMAAARLGFPQMFAALDQSSRLQTGLREGTLSGVRLFSHRVLELLRASERSDSFGVMELLKRYSPCVRGEAFSSSGDEMQHLAEVRKGVKRLVDICGTAPPFRAVLDVVYEYRLFEIPDSLSTLVGDGAADSRGAELGRSEDLVDPWEAFLLCPFVEVWAYREYVEDRSPFATHQGVKGREFARVLVVIDDSAARGFMFSYEKLFGVKAMSEADLRNEAEGRETGVDRVRRLFYVACTRAQSSLAVVAYSGDPEALRASVSSFGWFGEREVMRLE